MNKRIKDLIPSLSQKLTESSILFMGENLNEIEEMKDIFNLVLSAHISSLANSLKLITQGDEDEIETVNEFIKQLLEKIGNCHPIYNVERLN